MAAVIQMPAPQAEVVEQPTVRLAYTRKQGWVVIRCAPAGSVAAGWVRPGGKMLWSSDVLAWADLPPVPPSAL